MREPLRTIALWLVLVAQLAIPASYYFVRDDRDDERFAWRMFSSLRLTRCEVRLFEHEAHGREREVELSQALHASWVRALERGRRRVIERLLVARCRSSEVSSANLERVCTSPAARAIPTRHYRYDCQKQSFEVAQ